MASSATANSLPRHIETEKQNKDIEQQGIDTTLQPATNVGSVIRGLGWLDRFLAVWILLAMIIGIILGNFVEQTGPALQKGQFVGVSVPIALGLLVMMYPILCKVRYETLHKLFQTKALWVQIGFSIVMNWIVAPLLMVCHPISLCDLNTNGLQLGLAWAFLPDRSDLRTGLILVGLARCIAMVGLSRACTLPLTYDRF